MSLFGQPGGGSSSFGNSSNQQKPTSLFGASSQPSAFNASSQPQAGGLFSSAPTSQTAQSGGLFGSTLSAPQPQQSRGLFGGAPSQPQSQSGSSLFGAPQGQPQSQNQTQGGGGLFGSTQPSQPQQTAGSSLFGGSLGLNQNQQQAQPAQPSGSFFGTSTPPQTKPTLSLFGNTANTNTQPQQTQPQPQQPSLFGSNTNSFTSPVGNANRLPGTLTMGQSNSQPQQQTVPGVRIDLSNLRGTTRYNDLHDDLQKQIEQIDLFIQQQISFKDQCDALMPAHEQNLSTIPSDVDFVKAKLETAELTLSNDSDAINTMKNITQQDADDARIGFRAVENLKLPQQFHYSGIWRPAASTITPPRGAGSGDQASGPSSSTQSTDLVGYFNKQTQDLAKLLDMYAKTVGEIETHLGAVEASAMAQSHQMMFRRGRDGSVRTKEEQVAELAAVLRQFESGILGVAGKVGQVREDVVDVIEKESQGGVLLGYRR